MIPKGNLCGFCRGTESRKLLESHPCPICCPTTHLLSLSCISGGSGPCVSIHSPLPHLLPHHSPVIPQLHQQGERPVRTQVLRPETSRQELVQQTWLRIAPKEESDFILRKGWRGMAVTVIKPKSDRRVSPNRTCATLHSGGGGESVGQRGSCDHQRGWG